jgi:hypothetical protein
LSSSASDAEVLKEWNPLQIAVFFDHLKIVKYYCEIMKINVRASLKMPSTKKFNGDNQVI